MKIATYLGVATLAALGAICGVAHRADAEPIDVGDATELNVTGTTHDQCGGELKVYETNVGPVTIQRGVTKYVYVSVPRISWWCGDTLEHTTCPAGTQHVNVYHHKDSRQIDWTCLAP